MDRLSYGTDTNVLCAFHVLKERFALCVCTVYDFMER